MAVSISTILSTGMNQILSNNMHMSIHDPGPKPPFDSVDLDEFDFDAAAHYVEFATNKNLNMIASWEAYTGLDFNLYDIIIAHYLDFKNLNLGSDDIKKISNVVQGAMGITGD